MIDMITLPIVVENREIDIPDRHRILAAQRARQIIQEPTSLADTIYEKAITIALEKDLENKVIFVFGKEELVAQKVAKRMSTEELKTRARFTKDWELLTETKKQLTAYFDDPGIKEPKLD